MRCGDEGSDGMRCGDAGSYGMRCGGVGSGRIGGFRVVDGLRSGVGR